MQEQINKPRLKELYNELTGFLVQGYKGLLQHLSRTREVVPFCELPKENTPYVVLRHDVDYSPLPALRMAELESKLGIKATYFVLFSSRFYNLHEGHNVQIIRRISRLGHEVGLHYDTSQYQSYGTNPEKTLKIEIGLLEHMINRKVHSIARHGPWNRDPFYAIKGYLNANNPTWRGDLFLHDSCRAWTPYEALNTLVTDPPRTVQLLVHPEYWREKEISRKTFLEDFFENWEYENRKHKKHLEKWWVKDPTVLEYDARVAKSKNSSFHLSDKSKSDQRGGEFQRLRKLSEWYLINTSIGWQTRKATEVARSFGRKVLRLNN